MSDCSTQSYNPSFTLAHRLGQPPASLPHRPHGASLDKPGPWVSSYRSAPSPFQPRPMPALDYPTPQSAPSPTFATSLDNPDFEQVESSIGPNRVTTRGQRRALEAGLRTISYPSPHRTSSQYLSAMSPRVHSERSASDPTMSPSHRDRLIEPMSMSPPLNNNYPPTPDSQCYSPYTMYCPPRSLSHPRSASPALSTGTSISSTSAPQTFTIPRPDISSFAAARTRPRKQRLFNVDRKAICEYSRDHPGVRQEDIAAQYGVERSTISKILKNKDKWLNVSHEDDTRSNKQRPSKFPSVEEGLLKWLHEPTNVGMTLTDQLLRTTALAVARDLRIPEDKFKASSGWLENFKHRHGIRNGIREGAESPLRGTALHSATQLRQTAAFLESTSDSVPLDVNASPSLMPDRTPSPESNEPLDPVGHPSPYTRSSFRRSWPSSSHSLQAPAPQMPIDQSRAPLRFDNNGPDGADSSKYDMAVPSPGQILPPDDAQLAPAVYNQSVQKMYSDGHNVYAAAPTIPSNPVPDFESAEYHMNQLIYFFDTKGSDIPTHDEREVLRSLKCALFQAANGLPYTRDS